MNIILVLHIPIDIIMKYNMFTKLKNIIFYLLHLVQKVQIDPVD